MQNRKYNHMSENNAVRLGYGAMQMQLRFDTPDNQKVRAKSSKKAFVSNLDQ